MQCFVTDIRSSPVCHANWNK